MKISLSKWHLHIYKNESFAKRFSWIRVPCMKLCTAMKMSEARKSSQQIVIFMQGNIIFMHENVIILHENAIIMHGNFILSCIKIIKMFVHGFFMPLLFHTWNLSNGCSSWDVILKELIHNGNEPCFTSWSICFSPCFRVCATYVGGASMTS